MHALTTPKHLMSQMGEMAHAANAAHVVKLVASIDVAARAYAHAKRVSSEPEIAGGCCADCFRVGEHEDVVGADAHDDEHREEHEVGDVLLADDVVPHEQAERERDDDLEHAAERHEERARVGPQQARDDDERDPDERQVAVVEVVQDHVARHPGDLDVVLVAVAVVARLRREELVDPREPVAARLLEGLRAVDAREPLASSPHHPPIVTVDRTKRVRGSGAHVIGGEIGNSCARQSASACSHGENCSSVAKSPSAAAARIVSCSRVPLAQSSRAAATSCARSTRGRCSQPEYASSASAHGAARHAPLAARAAARRRARARAGWGTARRDVEHGARRRRRPSWPGSS